MFDDGIRDLVVVKKERKQNPDAGLITPIAYIDTDGSYTPVNSSDFPNAGDIFIRSGYTEYIHEVFDENELFKLTHYFEVEIYDDSPSTAKYRADAKHFEKSNVERFRNFELCPLIEVDNIPNPSNPYVVSLIENGYVFLFDGSDIVGPFEVSDDGSGCCKVSATEKSNLGGLPSHHVFRIPEDVAKQRGIVVVLPVNGVDVQYVKNIFDASYVSSFDKIDFISDEKLISWGAAKELVSEVSKRPTRKMLAVWKNSLSKIKNLSDEYEDRRVRLLALLEKIESVNEDWTDQIRKVLAENSGLIDDYIKRNEDALLGGMKEDLKKKAERDAKDQAKEIYNSVVKLKSERDLLEAEIKQKTEEKVQLEEGKSERLREELIETENELSKSIEELDSKRRILEADVAKRVEALELVNDIESLKDEVKYQETTRDRIKAKIETLEDRDLPKALAKIKTQLDVLQGVHVTEEQLKRKMSRGGIEIDVNDLSTTASDYVQDVQSYFEDYCNRTIDYDELANVLILLQNNFLTILAGPPGAGKTSTAYLLAEALGIQNSAFLPVSVARGWTSHRDILGYFNPISSHFQSAKTGMYNFLRNVSCVDNSDPLLSLILMDEANLSPIEHYWADFLTMCDEETSRTIDIGSYRDEDSLIVPRHLRFIATINNDNTTERLSPRLIDRAPIVSLPEQEVGSVSLSAISAEDKPLRKPYSYNSMETMFCADDEADFSDVEKGMLDKVAKIMGKKDGSPRMIISPRKINNMRRYCAVARDVLKEQAALDFALSQMILPAIEGFGEDYGKRLEELYATVDHYPKTKALLQDIIDRGKRAHHSYSFFV
ncbi:AAA family ATPase [Maridesulfovibrio sp.]|uniref:AAA family ATPase n=1 Tax=unclassified Maridesulfovibrio TaxID=2794999 RepID=UPI003B00D12C